ncbi:winged helix-turn-helix domain-containing protein [Agrococcus sp. SGAir0287]|uniref:winged helix-turn-helix domain-containing protein n=1 Tax=Agrococcus sp. SGAir0287 TaxID=2070347 RepID=UPI0010CD506E|nr:crosslink repair DNA glycosylase YcaQ family protein [Agrococcus sp. SGAir0287]QCR18729.1 hypothetical protein C1N71_04060 [Agrococcus sp. SGAir0287]
MARARLSAAEARRVAFAAQGFGARPSSVGTRQLSGALARLRLLQLDTVNVFERSHYLPMLARLGAYDRALLDRLVVHDRQPRRLGRTTELWAHEAAIVPVEDVPLLRFRAERFRAKPRNAAFLAQHARLVDELRASIRDRGPSTVGELEHPSNVRGPGGWWDRGDAYHAVHAMFRAGDLVVLGRRRFERVYDLAERALPAALQHAMPEEVATVELVRRAAVALGVGTVDDLRDYYRLAYLADARRAVEQLVEAGELVPVTVEGWGAPAYLHAEQRIPRTIDATSLLSPFDPIAWHRPRALRMFDFHYRISIYTPPEEREHGYYVLPVVVGDAIVGRMDLKSDRRAGVLRVQHAHVEPAFADRAGELAARIAPRVLEAAAWQGLEAVAVAGPGTWAPALRATLRS